MALEGQLSEFNLAEIFQLIAGQKKSGFLNLEGRQKMVFIFDKGVLISTRDRRSAASDPLERYLHNYGFFDQEQWNHIEYIKNNSSLDLTEILISEKILDEDSLILILRGIALEMTFTGMKLTRGRYHFTATRSTPQGVRGRIAMDVQGLLMESARRLDEEPRLAELFPTLQATFHRGKKQPPPDDLSSVDGRILSMAVAEKPLGDIIRQAKVDSFTTRERLRELCDKGFLCAVLPGQEAVAEDKKQEPAAKDTSEGELRSRVLTLVCVLMVLGIGYVRWQPLTGAPPLFAPPATGEAAETVGNGTTAGSVDTDPSATLTAARQLRIRQLRAEAVAALSLFHHRHGKYPVDLSLLVKEEMLPQPIYRLLIENGWTYQLNQDECGYSLTS